MKKSLLLLFIFIVVFIFVAKFILPDTKKSQSIPTEQSLRKFYNEISELNKNQDYRALYEYELPTFKRYVTLEQYIDISERSALKYNPAIQEYEINEITVEGNIGTVDRTMTACVSEPCDDKNTGKAKLKKFYIFSDGDWHTASLFYGDDMFYLPNNKPIICEKNTPYTMPSEFKRAISLIQQRLKNADSTSLLGNDVDTSREFVSKIDGIRNCLDIKYASSKTELGDAEGVFKFVEGGNSERLTILVSPKYESTDDLLTALLLIHEITHAYYFAMGTYYQSLGWDRNIECFENEADAFTKEALFYSTMTNEEKNSLLSRYNNSISEVNLFLTQMETILSTPGNKYHDKALKFVSNNPYYINQCKN